MLTSKNGRDEAGQKQNHGAMDGVQVVRLARILVRTELAKSVADAVEQRRIRSNRT